MNSSIVKAFIFLTEIGYWVIVLAILMIATYMGVFYGSFLLGLGIAIAGIVVTTLILGFAAMFIEIHKDLRKVKEVLERRDAERT